MSTVAMVMLETLSFVLGGVIPPKAQIMLYGPKGAGKSTLAAQIAAAARAIGLRVGWLLTEQSADEHGELLRSLGLSPGWFDIREVLEPSALMPTPDIDLLIVDSMHGFGQLRRQADYDRMVKFIRLCKRKGIRTILLSHATKAGGAVGPSLFQHVVDAVVRLSPAGAYHVLQIEKRRRLGAWATIDMPADVPLLLSSKGFTPSPFAEPTVANAAGFAHDRLVGVEALISLPPRQLHCPFLPLRRIRQLLATLKAEIGINVDPELVGLSILSDGSYAPSLDLALAVCITASYHRKPVPRDAVFAGGVGLRGQIQPLANDGPGIGVALADAPDRVFVSSSSAGYLNDVVPTAVQVIGVSSLSECFARLKL